METSVIASTIEDFIRGKFNVDPADSEFDANVHLFDYGYVDSFGAVELTVFVESSFEITISNSDLVLYPMNTINEIADFVAKRQNGAR
jgi:D-alanine--poly(phosphoribitol) ligase subunit 2